MYVKSYNVKSYIIELLLQFNTDTSEVKPREKAMPLWYKIPVLTVLYHNTMLLKSFADGNDDDRCWH